MKTKIIFFLPNLNVGGAEKVAVNMMRQLDRNKFQISLVLVTKIGKLLDLIPQDIEIRDLKSKKTMSSILKLRKVFSIVEPDIIFSTLFRTHIAVDLALLGIKNKPRTIYRSPNSPKLLLENKQLSKTMRFLLERAYKNANLIISQTPEMKDEIIKYHSVNADKIQVFLNPVDTNLIEEKIRNTTNPFDKDYINVVAAGRLTAQKGFDVLIKSFQKVVQGNKKYRLYIIGEDLGERVHLEKLVNTLNISEYVTLLGFQSNPYIYFYYSDLYVLSSRWEGLPNTVLENLYLKKPIIATRCIPFMDTLIANGDNGILVDVDDVDSLAKEILNYKTINTEHKTIKFDISQIASIFEGSTIK